MRMKHGSITLILIQLIVISVMIGALSPTVSAANNGANARARAISDKEGSKVGFVGGSMVKFYSNKGQLYGDTLLDEATRLAYVFTKSEEVVDPVSSYVIPLDESDALFQRTVSIADYLNGLGFTTSHSNLAFSLNSSHYSIGVSAYGPSNLFNDVFNINVDPYYDKTAGHPNTPGITIPEPIQEKVRSIEFPPQPELYGEAWPPPHDPPYYYRLSPNEDSAALMNTTAWSSHSVENVTGALEQRQTYGYDGTGVDVAFIDSGFYFNSTTEQYHQFYEYYYNDLLQNRYFAYDNLGIPPDNDEVGHGTAIVSNLLAVAPGINLHTIKVNPGPLDALQIALQINPDVVSCSWGYREDQREALGDYGTAMEATINTLIDNGAIVAWAGGNSGLHCWPASMPNVVAVGGVYVDEVGNYNASNYASSFDSILYPGRHVPDFCGTVGQISASNHDLIQQPTQPGSGYDRFLSERGDETGDHDGWLVASGTSSATPQVAGLAAIAKQLNSDITTVEFKNLVSTTAIDITTGYSADGDPAVEGYDNATGYGFIDVYETAREFRVRNINSGLSYATIQEAIDASETLDGHTIQVKAGTYYENLVVDKSLTILGQDMSTTIIDGGGGGIFEEDVVYIESEVVTISGFTIQNGRYGVHPWLCIFGSTITNNIISNNFIGIAIEDRYTEGVVITENAVSNNYIGIYLSKSSDNIIHHNSFIDNDNQANLIGGSRNTWNSINLVGNYWSDYTGEDNDGDGIGDTPYVINQQNQDDYPLMEKWFPGDVDGDGYVDMTDFYLWQDAWGTYHGDPDYNPRADMNYDCIVDLSDFYIWQRNFGKSIPY